MRIPPSLPGVFDGADTCPNRTGLEAIKSISLTSASLDNIGLVAVVCPFGGIGRRAALKMRFRKEFRFESGRGHHHFLISVKEINVFKALRALGVQFSVQFGGRYEAFGGAEISQKN